MAASASGATLVDHCYRLSRSRDGARASCSPAEMRACHVVAQGRPRLHRQVSRAPYGGHGPATVANVNPRDAGDVRIGPAFKVCETIATQLR